MKYIVFSRFHGLLPVVSVGLLLPTLNMHAAVSGQIVNLSSRAFDVLLRTDVPLIAPQIELFAAAEGGLPLTTPTTDYQALVTGATVGDDYARRQANRATRAAMTACGNTLFRVGNCETSTTYFVRVVVGGNAVWPTNNTRLAVTTLPAAEWSGGARQLLVDLGRDGTGWIGLLDVPGAAAPLASVAGDRATTNSTLFFNLTDAAGPDGLPVAPPESTPIALTLHGRLGSAATATSVPAAAPAPDTLVAGADSFQRNLLSLLVASVAGACTPAPGDHLLFDGSSITCRLDQSVVTLVDTQFVGYGWTGSGSIPVSGRRTEFTFALSTDSTVDWRFRTNFWVEVVSPHGTVDLPSGWYAARTPLVAAVTPDAEWVFSQWNGLAAGSSATTSFLVETPGQLVAGFEPVLVPGGDGLPEWWLTAAGLTGANRDPNADPDHDGMKNTQEWMADTSPTNRSSDLRITGLTRVGNAFNLAWRGGRESKQIVEVLAGDLNSGDWQPLATNLPPTETIGACAIQVGTNTTVFFRIKAER